MSTLRRRRRSRTGSSGRRCAAASSCRCCAASAARMRSISPRMDESSERRVASCDSMCCRCAAFCATTRCCSTCAFRSSSWLRWIASFDERTCRTMFASCVEVELTVSTRLSRSSKLVDPSSRPSVELSSVDVYALTSRFASDFCEIFRFARASVSCLRFSRRSPSIFCSRTFARLYCSTAPSRLRSIWLICPSTCCACACFDAMLPGSAFAAVATQSAPATRRTACAWRLREMITSSRSRSRRARCRRGPVRTSSAP